MSDLCDLNCADCESACGTEQQYIKIEENKNRDVVAVASEDNMVENNLSSCSVFITFEIENKTVKSEGIVFASDAEQHGGLAEYFDKLGVKEVVCNSSDEKTTALLEEKNIQVYTGYRGSTRFAIKSFLQK